MNNMNMSNVFNNRYKVPVYAHDNFKQKQHLNEIERIGLEAILVAFVQQYEEEAFGEVYSKNFSDFTRYNEDSVDILDGIYDTYIFYRYAIGSVWMTENGIPMLSCFLLESDEYSDPYEIVRNTDWMSECEHMLFRLD